MVSTKIRVPHGKKINYKLLKEGYKTVSDVINVVAGMETNIELGAPSTEYSVEAGVITLETTKPHPPVLKINELTLPDDTIYEGRDLILAPKGEYIIPDENRVLIEKNSGFTLMNNCNETQGIVDGFEAYSGINIDYTFPETFNTCRIILKGTSNDYDAGHNALFGENLSSTGVGFSVRNTTKCFSAYDNGWYDGKTALAKNCVYWFGIKYDGSSIKGYVLTDNEYTLDTLPEFSDWSEEWEIPNSNVLANKKFNIGYDLWLASEFWRGSIDLKGCQIEVDNEVVWKPQIADYTKYFRKYGNNLVIDENNVISGFNSTNYTRFSLWLPDDFNKFEFFMKGTYGGANSNGGSTFVTSTDKHMVYVSGNTLGAFISENVSSSYTLVKDKTYWFRVIYTTTDGYKLYAIEDNGEYALENVMAIPVDSWTFVTSSAEKFLNANTSYTFFLGRHYNPTYASQYWTGSISLNDVAIYVNDVLYWKPIEYNKYDYLVDEVFADTIDRTGKVTNFGILQNISGGVKKMIHMPYGSSLHTEFMSGDDVNTQQQVFAPLNGTHSELSIYSGQFIYWDNVSSNVYIYNGVTAKTYYKVDWVMLEAGIEITIKNKDDEVLVHKIVSQFTCKEANGIGIGNHSAPSLVRPLFGYVDLSKTYITLNDGSVHPFLKLKGLEVEGCFEDDFEDLYTTEQTVKLYSSTFDNKTNKLLLTKDIVNDNNVIYNQFVKQLKIPARDVNYIYNKTNQQWEIVS